MTPQERFWSHVNKKALNECWEWMGAKTWCGYGAASMYPVKKTTRAHRLAYELANGPIPDGLYVLHKCDNRACCNPAHLHLGTQRENMQERSRRGRGNHKTGEAHYKARLTVKQVHEIRVSKKKQADIAKDYGIAQNAVSGIQLGKTWKSVPWTHPPQRRRKYAQREKRS